MSQFSLFDPIDYGVDTGDAAPINGSAHFNVDRTLRWWLERRWAAGAPLLMIGMNPSLADERRNDPTIHRGMHFATAWGFPALLMMNLYPLVSPSPALCREWAKKEPGQVAAAENLLAIVDKIGTLRIEMIVAAWGNLPGDPVWAGHVAAEIMWKCDRAIHCLGTTKDGAPKHPLARGRSRVPDDQQPVEWTGAPF